MAIALGMVEKFAGLRGPELVHGARQQKNSPPGTGEMRLVAGV